MLVLSDREVDLESGKIAGVEGRLTQFECRLVKYFVERQGRVVSRDQLLVEVWEHPKPLPTRAVDTAIRRLRRKLESEPASPQHLLTVQGEGYRWVAARADGGGPLERWESQQRRAATFADGVAAMSAGARHIVSLMTLSSAGFTPEELGDGARYLRALAANGWVVPDGERFRLEAVWRDLGDSGAAARSDVVGIWTDRLRRGESVKLEEVGRALLWTEVEPEARARLALIASKRGPGAAGSARRVRWFRGLESDRCLPCTRVQLLLAEADALRSLGKLSLARECAARAVGVARTSCVGSLGAARGREGLMAHSNQDWPAAMEAYSEAVEILRSEQPGEAAVFLSELGVVYWAVGRAEQGLQTAREAHRLAGEALLDDPDASVARGAKLRASRANAAILVGLGRTWEALPRFEEMAEVAERDGLLAAVASARLAGATALLEAGELDRALPWLQRAEQAADAAGEVLQAALVQSGFGCLFFLQGDLDAAVRRLEHCIRMFDDADVSSRAVVPRCWVAVAAMNQGRIEDAQRALEVVLRLPMASPGVRGTVGLAAERIGVAGPAIPAEATHQAYFRMARRAWGESDS